MKITDYVIIMHNENLRSLSANQSRLILGMAEDARAEITKSAVVERIQVSPGYANKLLHELERKGWLHRVAHGRYRLVPAEWGPNPIANTNTLALALARAPEGYIGLGSAATIHGLTTQHRRVAWVVTDKQRRTAQIGEMTVHFVRVKPSQMFGVSQQLVLGEQLKVSDIEKTALDCLAYGIGRFDFSELTAIVLAAARQWDWGKLVEYLEKLSDRPAARRLGYLLDTAEIDFPLDARKGMLAIASGPSRMKLDPHSKSRYRGGVEKVWRIEVNVPTSDLFKV